MGRLPLLLAAQARRALVVCLGAGATARAVAESSATLDVVDVNPDVFACAPASDPGNPALLARANGVVEDGRRFLREGGRPYDVITQEPMPPSFPGMAALYSVEYYELAKSRLSEGGVLAQWLPLHLVSPRDARQIVAAALAAFTETWVVLAPGAETAIVLGSPQPLDPARLERARRELGVEVLLDPAAARRYAAGTDPVTDDRPSLEYRGPDRVGAQFPTPESLGAFNIAEMRAASPGVKR